MIREQDLDILIMSRAKKIYRRQHCQRLQYQHSTATGCICLQTTPIAASSFFPPHKTLTLGYDWSSPAHLANIAALWSMRSIYLAFLFFKPYSSHVHLRYTFFLRILEPFCNGYMRMGESSRRWKWLFCHNLANLTTVVGYDAI